jgi:hypothetical protein
MNSDRLKKRLLHILLAVVLAGGCGMGILTQNGTQKQAGTEGPQPGTGAVTAEGTQLSAGDSDTGQSVEASGAQEPETGSGEMEFLTDFWKSLFIGKRELVVGRNLDPSRITEFRYTLDMGTYPPLWHIYRFYKEDGKNWFYHETREGDRAPLTEEDVVLSGTAELTAGEWEEFCVLMEGGVVRKKEGSDDDGDEGSLSDLYWDGDQSLYRTFSFVNQDGELAFREFCMALEKK